MTIRTLGRGKVVPFARSTDYWHQRGLVQRQNQQPLDALELLRMAASQSPKHVELMLDLAETYAELTCFEQSNRILFQMLAQDMDAPEVFFGLGCNFFSLRIYPLARDCLHLYLRADKDPAYEGEAKDMLALLDNHLSEGGSRRMRRMVRAVTTLEEGKPRLAARQFRRLLALDPWDSAAYTLLAFAWMAEGQPMPALQAARLAWKLSPSNVRALCAMAAANAQRGDKKAALLFLDRAVRRICDESDQALVCQTACEVKAHHIAYTQLRMMTLEQPYNPQVLHMMAVACFYVGKTKESLRHFNTLRRLDPQDSVSMYYSDAIRKRLYNSPLDMEGFAPLYAQQVPAEEAFIRLKGLRDAVRQGMDAIRTRWQEDAQFAMWVRWGLEQPDMGIRSSVMNLVAFFQDEKAEALLKAVLTQHRQSEAIKFKALRALHTMGVKGPFCAVFRQRLTSVHVEEPPDEEMPTKHRRTKRNTRRIKRSRRER